jgi:hypothetical protein
LLRSASIRTSSFYLRSRNRRWRVGSNESDPQRFDLSCSSTVAIKQTTESLFATNLRNGNRDWFRRPRFGFASLRTVRSDNQLVLKPLMRSFFVIMDFKFLAKNIHVLVPKNDEMIQNLLLDCLDESLGKGDHVGRTDGCSLSLDFAFLERCQKRLRILPIVIMHQDPALGIICFGRGDKRLCLLDHPFFIGLIGRRRDEDSARFDVNEDEHEDISKSRLGNDLLREEVALPQRFGMPKHEFVPSSRTTFLTDVLTIPFENRFNCVPSNGSDAELSKFTKNSGVSPTVILCQFEDQFLKFSLGSRSSQFLILRFISPARFVRIANPLSQSIRMNDRAKMVQRRTQTSAKSNEPILFTFSQFQPLGQSSSEKLVLDLKKADVTSQFFVRGLRQNKQKCGVDIAKAGHRVKSIRSRKTLGGRYFCTPWIGSRVVADRCAATLASRRKDLCSNLFC